MPSSSAAHLDTGWTAVDPERSSEALASTCLRQCSPEIDDTPAATCNQSRTTKFTNRPGTAISFRLHQRHQRIGGQIGIGEDLVSESAVQLDDIFPPIITGEVGIKAWPGRVGQ